MSNRKAKRTGGNKRALVIDEYSGAEFVIAAILKSAGYAIQHVMTAAAALAAVQTFQPDLILLEWRLQNDEGIGLAERLRGASAKHLVIVVVSTQDEPEGFTARENVDGYFVKPVMLAEVLRSIASRASSR